VTARARHILTRPHAATVAAVYGGGAIALLPVPWWDAAAGVVALTLVEYVVHRWVFHGAGRWAPARYDAIHGAHHRLPADPGRRLVPLTHSLPVAALAYALVPSGVLAGMLLGYLAYEVAHTISHLRGPLRWPLSAIRRHHARHHGPRDDRAFGVTSPLWDRVFGTMP
jgi:sterol desaturase/sphingolipid hydroxylase (fatty acid hydroxylase superfamily)